MRVTLPARRTAVNGVLCPGQPGQAPSECGEGPNPAWARVGRRTCRAEGVRHKREPDTDFKQAGTRYPSNARHFIGLANGRAMGSFPQAFPLPAYVVCLVRRKRLLGSVESPVFSRWPCE